ncbi:uncharacterized protein I303_103449 [Kwoniella dejecticola CBS 10117]|uniref:Uncharacterized protein n=1 Tax=Kwoniella dejecticola CBS 10117 TaxID=1296121 RepID=A0A1A6A6S9_9TREE|nr:uncharacterized protein I303_03472 [Kwoniella dejecticola CBS 10117]OBR85760.1 hypothetical protein I303_03472 [Kwoniella dejecticola CBS 10117]
MLHIRNRLNQLSHNKARCQTDTAVASQAAQGYSIGGQDLKSISEIISMVTSNIDRLIAPQASQVRIKDDIDKKARAQPLKRLLNNTVIDIRSPSLSPDTLSEEETRSEIAEIQAAPTPVTPESPRKGPRWAVAPPSPTPTPSRSPSPSPSPSPYKIPPSHLPAPAPASSQPLPHSNSPPPISETHSELVVSAGERPQPLLGLTNNAASILDQVRNTQYANISSALSESSTETEVDEIEN